MPKGSRPVPAQKAHWTGVLDFVIVCTPAILFTIEAFAASSPLSIAFLTLIPQIPIDGASLFGICEFDFGICQLHQELLMRLAWVIEYGVEAFLPPELHNVLVLSEVQDAGNLLPEFLDSPHHLPVLFK